MIAGLDHVAIPLPAEGEDKARAFYVGLLGMVEIPKPHELARRGGVWFQMADGRQIHLQAGGIFAPLTGPHPAFRCPDLSGAARKLLDAGCDVRWDEAYDDMRRFYVDDPFGNRLEMLEIAE